MSPRVMDPHTHHHYHAHHHQQQTREHAPAHWREGRQTRPRKPLASGFKTIVWTVPPPGRGLYSSHAAAAAPAAAATGGSPPNQRAEARGTAGAPAPAAAPASPPSNSFSRITRSPNPNFEEALEASDQGRRSKCVEVEVEVGTTRTSRSTSQGSSDSPPAAAPAAASNTRARRSIFAADARPRRTTGTPSPPQRPWNIGDFMSAGTTGGLPSSATEMWSRPPKEAAATAGNRYSNDNNKQRVIGISKSHEHFDEGDGGLDDSMSASLPALRHTRRPSIGNMVLERSLSDTSVVTASDFGGPSSKPHRPIILPGRRNDEEAIEELVGLLATGKGLPVVKQAPSGAGGAAGLGKSRKLLKLNQQGGYLALCGMMPPYFKTKIPLQDVDRVDAKWCCVVVHARGRSPLRLEVDSFETADILRVGLMAASKAYPTPPPLAAEMQRRRLPPPAAAGTAEQQQEHEQQQRQPDPEQVLSSVRPGHCLTEVYDPDAALSVAALLAKEMEEERMLALKDVNGRGSSVHNANGEGPISASARNASRPDASLPGGGAGAGSGGAQATKNTKPLLRRSASMNSVVSSSTRQSEQQVTVDPITSRRSLPRAYGGPMVTAQVAGGQEELVVVDPKASLRRLYDAIEGRGMAAIKRNPNGKGRSRVLVKSRIKENTVGWAHTMPPFKKKFYGVDQLVGAKRTQRIVTVTFRGREPVIFETDKLTDALILEQGFFSLARLQEESDARLRASAAVAHPRPSR